MPPEIVAAILGVAGLVIGAILQFFFTRHFERKKERRERLLNTYRDLLTALNTLASAQAAGGDHRAQQRDFEIAKTQFILDGGASSIRLFSEWMIKFGKLDSPESRKDFACLMEQLRADCLESKSDVIESDIRKFLFREE